MARHTSGWVKLHRQIMVSPIYQDGYALAIFTTILCWANYKPGKTIVNKQLVHLDRGELATSTLELASRFGWDRKTVERKLLLLEKNGTIVQRTSRHGRIIAICNYEKYQGDDDDDGTTVGTTVGTYSEEDKKRRKKELRVNPQLAPKGSGGTPLPCDYALGDSWWDFAYSVVPTMKRNREASANAIRLMREVDGLTEAQIRETLEFIRGDQFWRQQALSPVALRGRSKNGLKKLENVRLAMQRDGGGDHLAAMMAALPVEVTG